MMMIWFGLMQNFRIFIVCSEVLSGKALAVCKVVFWSHMVESDVTKEISRWVI